MAPPPEPQHEHRFHETGVHAERKTLRVAVLTLAMMAAEIGAGWVFGSMALLADGWHMGTHAAALGVSWAAFVLARRCAADRRFVFGTWKIEVLGGFVSAVILGVVGVGMIAMAADRLRHPVEIRFNMALLVAAVGLVVNLVSVLMLGDAEPAHENHGTANAAPGDHAHRHGNLNLRAAYLHVAADAITSVLAIVALLGAKYLHWTWLDPLVAIAGAALILRWAAGLVRVTGAILLDREDDDALAAQVRAALERDGETRVHDLYVWRVGQDRYACLVALTATHPHPPDAYRERLRDMPQFVHVTVEVAARPEA